VGRKKTPDDYAKIDAAKQLIAEGKSQREAAEIVGLPRTTLTKWLLDEQNHSPNRLGTSPRQATQNGYDDVARQAREALENRLALVRQAHYGSTSSP
jgi:hypothetical protein